jgi:hypothetical protein
MTSIRDRLKSNVNQGSNFKKLNYDLKLFVKEHQNTPVFQYYVRAEEGPGEHKHIPQSIKGIFIGRCMSAEWFDQKYGNKGGTWSTAPYIKNDNVTLFSPDGKVAKKGTMVEIDNYLMTHGVRVNPKKFQMILFRMKTTGGWKTVTVNTNISIAITLFKQFAQSQFVDNEIVLTPKLYAPGAIKFDKNTPEGTLRLMATNPPKYAAISLGEALTDAVLEESGVESAMTEFKEWAESVGAKQPETQNVASPTPSAPNVTAEVPPVYSGPSQEEFDTFDAPVSDGDDIPF